MRFSDNLDTDLRGKLVVHDTHILRLLEARYGEVFKQTGAA